MVNEKNPSGQRSLSANHSEMKTFQSNSTSMKSEPSRSAVNSTNWHSQNLIDRLADIPESWALTPILDKSPLRPDWQHEPVIPRDELSQLLRDGQQLWSEKKQQQWHCRWTGYGLRTGEHSHGLIAIDVDGSTAAQLLEILSNEDLPLTPEWTSGKPGKRQLAYQLPEAVKAQLHDFNRSVLNEWGEYQTLRDEKGKPLEQLEFRYNCCQSALPPSKHPETDGYKWMHSPENTPVAVAPQWLCDLLMKLAERERSKTEKPRITQAIATDSTDKPWDIRNFASYLEGYNPNGRKEAITCKCPAHNGTSDNSLHIERATGAFKCHAECDSKAVYHAALEVAKSKGYQIPQQQPQGKERKIADLLLEIALQADYFHTPDDKGYADLVIAGHRKTYPIRSKQFKDWLQHQLFTQYHKAAGSETMNSVLNVLEGQARFGSEERSVFLRVAEYEGKIYLDLGTRDWTAVEISVQGWQIVSDYPVRFRRSPSMLPLPTPEAGGNISELKQVLNFSDRDWVLVLCWLSFCLYPNHPHPILILSGEQGAGKSFTSKTLKGFVDPQKSPLLSEPKDLRDLAISANNRWLLGFDNLSGISNYLSDALCRIATGGGFATRTLYENDQETIFEFTRPIVINGIDSLATRSDLLERSILITLPTIPEDRRLTEHELRSRLEKIESRVFGALLTAVSETLKKLPDVQFNRLPRMADFAKWAIAAEVALGFTPGSFLATYDSNRQTGHETALEASPVATGVCKLMETKDLWEGTASDLLKELELLTDERTIRSRNWANSSRSLGKTLVRIAPDLRGVGIECTRPRSKNRLIRLEKTVKQTPQLSLTSELIQADNFSSTVKSDVSTSYKVSNTQKTSPGGTKAGYQLQTTSDISDVSDVSQPKPSNSSQSISSRITVGSMVHKQHKTGWTGRVNAIDGNTAKVLWVGDKFPSMIPLQELRLGDPAGGGHN